MINTAIYEAKSEKLKVLANPYRLCIVKGLMEKSCNVTNIKECLDIPQSTVSQHLAKLKAAGIVEGKRSRTEIEYSVVDKEVINIINILFNDED